MAFYACIVSCCMYAQSPKDFAGFRDNFISTYKTLGIPPVNKAYAVNLQNIGSLHDIQHQLDFFTQAQKKISVFSTLWLTEAELFDLDIMKFETIINLQRLALEKKWLNERPSVIVSNNINAIPRGKEWYSYLLNRHIGAIVNADEIFLNAYEDAEWLQQQISTLAMYNGLLPEQLEIYLKNRKHLFNDPAEVKLALENISTHVAEKLPLFFESTILTPVTYIEKIASQNNAQFSRTDLSCNYIHNTIPGIAFQKQAAAASEKSAVQQLFNYDSFSEAWGAYVETLGKEMGIYQQFYEEAAQLHHALRRSLLTILDIGINYYGWTDDKAMATWHQFIPSENSSILPEIDFIKHAPGYAVTSTYGCTLLLQWKKALQQKQGATFNIRDFHTRLLSKGALPYAMIRKQVFRQSIKPLSSAISAALR